MISDYSRVISHFGLHLGLGYCSVEYAVWGLYLVFYWLLRRYTGNRIKIRPLKQCHSAIRRNTDTVSFAITKWIIATINQSINQPIDRSIDRTIDFDRTRELIGGIYSNLATRPYCQGQNSISCLLLRHPVCLAFRWLVQEELCLITKLKSSPPASHNEMPALCSSLCQAKCATYKQH